MEAAGTGKTGTPRLSTKCTNWSNVVRSLFFVAIASACGEKLGGGNSSIHNATLLLSHTHTLSLASWRDPVFFLMLETEARGGAAWEPAKLSYELRRSVWTLPPPKYWVAFDWWIAI